MTEQMHSIKRPYLAPGQALQKPDSNLENGVLFPQQASIQDRLFKAGTSSQFARGIRQVSSHAEIEQTPAPRPVASSPMQPSSR